MGTMGRKPAPQPLALSDTTLAVESQDSGETLQINSPADSRSPRSPRSPFRLTNKKVQSVGGKQPLHVADLVQQQSDDEADYPPISSAIQPSCEDQSLQQQPQQQSQPEPQQQPRQQPQQQQQQQPQQQQRQRQQEQQEQQRKQQRKPSQPQQQQYSSQPQPQPQQQQNYTSQAAAVHGHHRHNDEKASKSGFFFHFGKSAKSTERLNAHQYTDSRSENMSKGPEYPPMTKQTSKQSDASTYADRSAQQKPPSSALPTKPDLTQTTSAEYESGSNSSKRGKPKPFTILGRTRSIRDKDNPSPQEVAPPVKITEPERVHTFAPLRTAPIAQHDRSFRDMMSSAVRNHSADRSQPRDISGHRDGHRERDHPRTQPSSLRDNGGSAFLSGLKNSSSRAADMISKGLFGKNTRSGSTTEREPVVDDEHYVLKVINLPLVEQTRLTRISKRLEDSRDKTEFWMPAFPWRAIDYLNYKGTDVEGLYRVPGSGPQIKKWQRKFDEEYDVDLFAQEDLYDINIIGSMLKAWLRELPDELFPKEAQERIARECAGADKVPPMLVEELSNLSPFNYYLLFAITCHLSLLLAHSDKNKMDFRNLCICFQPCMKIDAFSFKFLVCDWRDCWKGCKNEARFIEEEYLLFDQPPPRGISASRDREEEEAMMMAEMHGVPKIREVPDAPEERNVSSSDSSKQSNRSGEHGKSRPKKKPLATGNASVASTSTISTTLTIDSQRETPPRRSGDLRPLSPIKPLSPLGF